MDETIPYDKYQLQVLLGEVQGYLAELRYIDTAMGYMAQEEASGGERVLKSLLTQKDVHYIDVEFGRTFPFTKTYTVTRDWYDGPFGLDDTREDRIRARLAELATEADEWAGAEIETIKARIEPLTWPEGSLYLRECIVPLQDMQVMLEDRVSHDFGLLRHTISSWRGEAADNFDGLFYSRFEHTLRSQKQMLTALMGGIVAAKAIAESTQHSLMNVAHATKLALREQLQLAQATAALERQQSAVRALIIAGGLTTVFGGILAAVPAVTAGSAAGLWSASLTVVAGSAQLATLGIPEDGATEHTIEGGTAEALCNSLSDAIVKIMENEAWQHDRLLREVDAALGRVETLRAGDDGEDARLIPIRPDLVDGVDSESFYVP